MRVDGGVPREAAERFGALRETCQVYARDTRDGSLLYLEDGGGDRVREAAKAGFLVCPMPECADPRFGVVAGEIRRHHFRHLAKGLAPHHARAVAHHDAVFLVAEHLSQLHSDATVAVTGEGRERPAEPDIEMSFPDGRRFRFYVECGRLASTHWCERHGGDRANRITDVWLFSHLSPHFRLPRHEADRDAIQLGSLLEELSVVDVPVYFLDHLRAEIATALVETGGRLAREHGVEIAVDLLAECEIDGEVFLSPAAREERQARLERIQRAERLERERLEREQRLRERWIAASRSVGLVSVSTRQRTSRVVPDEHRRENAARWAEARATFLEHVGLREVPSVISVELATDAGIHWLAPAHWHARYFWKFIQGKLGKRFEFYDALNWFHQQHERHGGVFDALEGYNLYLRDAGYLDFTIGRADLPVTISVLADLTHPPADTT